MRFLFRLSTAAICALPLLAARCGTDAEPVDFSLPPVTQTGANTFGFVLDGRVWRDYGYSCLRSGPCGSNNAQVRSYTVSRGEFQIRAGLTTKQYSEHLYLSLVGVKQPGTYAWLPAGSALTGAQLGFDADDETTTYTVRPGRSGIIITRLDTVQRVIAGTFTGVLRQRADTTKTLTITDGRFDLKYY